MFEAHRETENIRSDDLRCYYFLAGNFNQIRLVSS